jgi:hypothetical protein
MNPVIWFKLRKYRPKIDNKEYNKRLISYYGFNTLNSFLLFLNVKSAAGSILYSKEISIWLILLTFFAVGITSFALIYSKKDKETIQDRFGLTSLMYNQRKKIWKYIMFGGKMPKPTIDVEFPIYEDYSPVIIDDGDRVILNIFKDYLKYLEPALGEGLNKSRFLKLKMLYG